jgi:hypothetical protein
VGVRGGESAEVLRLFSVFDIVRATSGKSEFVRFENVCDISVANELLLARLRRLIRCSLIDFFRQRQNQQQQRRNMTSRNARRIARFEKA